MRHKLRLSKRPGTTMSRIARTLALVALAAMLYAPLTVSSASARQERPAAFEEIDRYVQEQIDGSRIPGAAIAVVQDGEIVHTRGFGSDGGSEITPRTPFPIGSLTKSFTALSIMQLAEAGKIVLDAPVQQYLPTFRIADPGASARITVRHLLNQTSGFSRASGIKALVEEWDGGEDYIRRLRTTELNRPVGESYEYSNINYVILGALIEAVSDQGYAEYVQQHIFEPLDMTNSYTSHREASRHGMASPHRYWFGLPVKSTSPELPGQTSAGFLAASAEDMARYLTMYLDGGSYAGRSLLSPDGVAEMHRPNTNEFTRPLLGTTFTARYGMGWFSGAFGGEAALWHLGQLPSFNAWMVLMPETNQALVVLINAGSQLEFAGANQVMSRIPVGVTNLLTGREPPAGPGLKRFYLVFDLVLIAILTVQLLAIFRLARKPIALRDGRPGRGPSLALRAVPLVWEVGLGLMILLAFPAVTSGAGWRGSMWSMPDLTIAALTIASLWLLTGLIRTARLAQLLVTRHAEPAGPLPDGLEEAPVH